MKKNRSEEQRKNNLKKNRGRIDLKRNDLEPRRIEEERRDELVDWTIERWVGDWTIWSSDLQCRRMKKNARSEECEEEEGEIVIFFHSETQVLKTQIPCGYFPTSDAITYKSRLRNSSFILKLEI